MANAVGFKPETAGRIMAVVNAAEAKGQTLTPQASAPRSAVPGFWAEITGAYDPATGYPWKRLKPKADGKGLEDCTPAIAGMRLFEVKEAQDVTTGTRVWITPNGVNSTGDTFFVFAKGGGGGALPVTLTWNAGADGNGTDACTWTYDCKDAAGAFIKQPSGANMTAVVPAHNRSYGKTIKATMGTLRRKADGTWELYQTDEISNFKVCV